MNRIQFCREYYEYENKECKDHYQRYLEKLFCKLGFGYRGALCFKLLDLFTN